MSSFHPQPHATIIATSGTTNSSFNVESTPPNITLIGDENDTSGIYIHREASNGTICDIDVTGDSTTSGYAGINLHAIGRGTDPSFKAYVETDATSGATLSLYNATGSGGDITLTATEATGNSTITVDGHEVYHDGNLDPNDFASTILPLRDWKVVVVPNAGSICSFTQTNTYGNYTGTFSYRGVIPATSITSNASSIRVKLHASDSTTCTHVSIVERSSGASGTTTPTEITFNSGQSGFTVTTAEYIYSDFITYSIDETKDYILIIDYSTRGGSTYSYGAVTYGYSGSSTWNVQTPGTPTWDGTNMIALCDLQSNSVSLLSVEDIKSCLSPTYGMPEYFRFDVVDGIENVNYEVYTGVDYVTARPLTNNTIVVYNKSEYPFSGYTDYGGLYIGDGKIQVMYTTTSSVPLSSKAESRPSLCYTTLHEMCHSFGISLDACTRSHREQAAVNLLIDYLNKLGTTQSLAAATLLGSDLTGLPYYRQYTSIMYALMMLEDAYPLWMPSSYYIGEWVRDTESLSSLDRYIPNDNTILSASTATYTKIQDYVNCIQSSGRVSGGFITEHSPADGTVDVSALTGFIKTSDSTIAETKFFDFPSQTSIALTDNSINYLYVEYNSGSPRLLVTTDRSTIRFTDQFTLGRAFRSGTDVEVLTSGINLYNRSRLTHEKWIDTFGAVSYASGLIVSFTGLKPAFTAGVMYAGSNKITINALDCNTSGTFDAYYTSDNGSTWTIQTGQTSINNTQYNDPATGLATLSNNQYGIHWLYICPNGEMYMLYGKASYTLSAAQAMAQPVTQLPNYLSQWAKLAAKIIILKSGTTPYSITMAWSTQFPVQNPGDHNSLASLQGGTSSEYYHLTSTQHTTLTGNTFCRWRGSSSSEPTSNQSGDIYINTGDSKPYIYNGSTWTALT